MSPSRLRARIARQLSGPLPCRAPSGASPGLPTCSAASSAPTRSRSAAFRPDLAERKWDWRRSPARPGASVLRAGGLGPGFAEAAQAAFAVGAPQARFEAAEPAPDLIDCPLGAARAQIHGTYIVAQTR